MRDSLTKHGSGEPLLFREDLQQDKTGKSFTAELWTALVGWNGSR